MMEEEELLTRCMSGTSQFSNAGNLRLEWVLLQSTLPSAFLRRTAQGTGKPTQWVGLRRDGNRSEWKATLKAEKDREEGEMREERLQAKGRLLAAVTPAVISPVKRSLTAALNAVKTEDR
jgi:hypothetical protein